MIAAFATDEQLLKRLHESAAKPVTKSELARQQISFVYGNLPSDSNITRDQVPPPLIFTAGAHYRPPAFNIYLIPQNHHDPAYQGLALDNLQRQYHFLRSVINAAVATGRPMISTTLIKALNAHAIACLHVKAGEYRPCEVTVGNYDPPQHFRVPDLMNDFINEVNYIWDRTDPIYLAAYVLWKINRIHPFINGNGRTARALCYYVVCVKLGGLLKGDVTLPELIRQNRNEYVGLLKHADANIGDPSHLFPLAEFIKKLVQQQLESTEAESAPSDASDAEAIPVDDGAA